MGSVWLAHDQSLDSQCAIKLVDPDKALNEEVRVRFEREARAAAQIRGAHVVDIFDHGVCEGTPFIVMEFLEGEDLGARLERAGRLDVLETYQIIGQVARALVRAHAAGIVHRDLKPENIFLVPGDEHEVAKVLDFGIAKHEQYSLAGKTTKTGSFMGTPYYMSPEQARGKNIDWRSDLWALGVIAFQCLTGHPPFESDALGELMGMILYDSIPRLTAQNPNLPVALDKWWEQAVARDREQRFQSAKEFADAFGLAILARQVAVPSIAPRAPFQSVNELDSGSAALLLTSYPRLAVPGSSSHFDPAPLFNDKTLDGTGAPVARTRRSVLPDLGSLPAKQRLIVLTVGGALLAVLGFLVIAAFQSSPEPRASAARPVRAGTPVTPEARSRLQPPPIIFGPTSLPREADTEKKKKSASGASSVSPAPVPRAEAVRDYGI